jgi:DNA-binding CsgD family transcriptional regulator
MTEPTAPAEDDRPPPAPSHHGDPAPGRALGGPVAASTPIRRGGRGAGGATGPEAGAQPIGVLLTDRQADVLRLTALGHTNARIGAHLWISTDTVAGILTRARRALGARDRTHAVVLAHRAGLINLDTLEDQ